MSLRAKIVAYVVALHLILGSVLVFVLIDRPWLLLIFETMFVISGALGYVLIRSFFVPLALIRTGAELLRERDFTTHFATVGQPEMDELIRIYNAMAERLKHERLQLEERNVLLNKIVSASPTGLVALDHDGRIHQFNPGAERLLAVSAASWLGRPLDGSGGPALSAMAALAPGQSILVSPDGLRRLRCRRTEFFDRGAPRSFFLIEELTEELRASEKAAYGKVIRLMSHEVNNSIGSVRSLIESCATYGTQLGEEDRRDFETALEVASGRLQRLNAFMRDLASVARVPPPDRRPCDLGLLVTEVTRLIEPELASRRITLIRRIAPDLPEVDLDKNQIEQVLVNVLRNAIEAVVESGEIQVAVGRERREIVVSILDSGPGVAEEVRPRLLTPFFSTKREGQGIGLTLAGEILSRHGFEFALRNRDTRGAEFRIGIPSKLS